MAHYAEDTTLEVVENDFEPRKGGFLGKFIALLLGVILGIAATLGGIVGAGYIFINKPVDEVVNTVNKFGVNIDVSQYLREEYANKKILDLFGDVGGAVAEIQAGKGTLSSLDAISPKVGELVGKLAEGTNKLAIPITKEDLMAKPLSEMPSYFKESINKTALGDCLLAMGKPLTPMMEAISYGERDVDYYVNDEGKAVMIGDAKKTTVADLLDGDMMNILGRITMESVIDVSPTDTVMCAIAYGPSTRYTVVGDTIVMNQVVYFTEDEVTFKDDLGEVVTGANIQAIEGGYKLDFATDKTNEDGTPVYETQYIFLNNADTGEYLAFYDLEKTKLVTYKKTKIKDLQKDAMSIIDSVLLKDALSVDETSHGILRSLAYGEEGVAYFINSSGKIEMNVGYSPRTIGELRTRGENLINDIYLKDIMTANTDDAITMFLLYGKQGIHYDMDSDSHVTMRKQHILIYNDGSNNFVYNEYGEKVAVETYDLNTTAQTYSVKKNGEIVATYKYVLADDMPPVTTEDDNMATAYYLRNMEDEDLYYKATTLGDLAGGDNVISDISKRLTIGEVLGKEAVEENRFFKHVQDETVESLPHAIEELTIQQVFADSVYKTDADGNFLDKNDNITTNRDEYVLEGSWWYLLTSYDEHGNEVVKDYTLNEMDALIANMKTNVHNATIRKLYKDGMITDLDPTTLNSEVRGSITSSPLGDMTETLQNKGIPYSIGENKAYMGDLTVEQMMNYVNVVFETIGKLGL